MIGEVLGEVVSRLVGSFTKVVVVRERRRELVRLAAEEAVPALEAAPERPARPGRAEVRFLMGGEMPLPTRVCGVAGVAQDLGQEAARLRP